MFWWRRRVEVESFGLLKAHNLLILRGHRTYKNSTLAKVGHVVGTVLWAVLRLCPFTQYTSGHLTRI